MKWWEGEAPVAEVLEPGAEVIHLVDALISLVLTIPGHHRMLVLAPTFLTACLRTLLGFWHLSTPDFPSAQSTR